MQRPDGSIAYANDAAARALGFDSPEELLATPPLAIVDRLEILNEAGEPSPLDRFPGRIVLQGADDRCVSSTVAASSSSWLRSAKPRRARSSIRAIR